MIRYAYLLTDSELAIVAQLTGTYCLANIRAAAIDYFFYSSTRPSILTCTRVLVNTGSTLIQAANDEERGDGLVGERPMGPPKGQGLDQA